MYIHYGHGYSHVDQLAYIYIQVHTSHTVTRSGTHQPCLTTDKFLFRGSSFRNVEMPKESGAGIEGVVGMSVCAWRGLDTLLP